jgi:signal transduction histidine kinase
VNSSAAPAQGSILIVDDDPVARMLMRASLEDAGFAVVEAGDGDEACKLCEHNRADLVIVDAVMPQMDGFALCRELRRRPAWAYVPILMATGLEDASSITAAYEAGATDFITKPIQWIVLNQRVRYMLRASTAFQDLRLNQQRLLASMTAAEAANHAKTEFLANMSHELRTPLNAIIGYAEVMRDRMFGPLSDKYADYAGTIVQGGGHLLAIINDILDISRAETNRLELEEEEVDIQEIVGFTSGVVRDMAKAARVNFSVSTADDVPRVYADAAKLRQVLINLLSNAIKFTPAGGKVQLTVPHPEDGGLVLHVEDSGIGIGPDQLPLVLMPFGQVGSQFTRKHGGIGLGLPLTKRLVELHGGTLDITSGLGVGTIVTVCLPRHRVRG